MEKMELSEALKANASVLEVLFSLHDTAFNSKFQIRSESCFVNLHFFWKFIGMVIEPCDHFIQFLFGIRFFSVMIHKLMLIVCKDKGTYNSWVIF